MTSLVAHGLGDAGVLPVPLPVLLLVAGGAVLGFQARLSIAERPARDRVLTLPRWVTTVVDAHPTRVALRLFGLLAAALVLVLAAAGPASADTNPATRLVLVVGWAGLIPLSFVAPGAWRAISPLRSLSAGLARLTGDPQERDVRPLPDGLGWWPAAAALSVFAIVEGPLRGEPTALLVFLVAYGLVQLAAAAVYGSNWYAHAEAFEVLAAIVGRLSSVDRGSDGQLRLTSPRCRLAAPVPAGTIAVVGVLIGSALADFVEELPAWNRVILERGAATALSIVLLLAAIGGAMALVSAAARPRVLAPAVLPLVVGYLFAHYFVVLLIEGQVAFAQLGALLRGSLAAVSANQISIRYELLPGTLAATIQLLGFLIPHLVAVAVGVDIARTRFGPDRVRRATAPLVGIVAVSAVAGTALRYGAG